MISIKLNAPGPLLRLIPINATLLGSIKGCMPFPLAGANYLEAHSECIPNDFYNIFGGQDTGFQQYCQVRLNMLTFFMK
jgi:hypothetical protein